MPYLDVAKRREAARRRYEENKNDPEWIARRKEKLAQNFQDRANSDPEYRSKRNENCAKWREDRKAGLPPKQRVYPEPPIPRASKKRTDKEEQKAHWKEYLKVWRQTPGGRRSDLNHTYKRKYDMTILDYDSIYEVQDGKCLICGEWKPIDGKRSGRLHVDHCHVKGHFRGLLCTLCNTMIGHCRENIEILKNAIAYLEQFKDD